MVEVLICKIRNEYLVEAFRNGVHYQGWYPMIPWWVPVEEHQTLRQHFVVSMMWNERDLNRLNVVKKGLL